MELDQKIEALLFSEGALRKRDIASLLGEYVDNVEKSLEVLKGKLSNRGVQLVERDDEIMLGTRSEFGKILEGLRKEELEKELSKAKLETLSIILYKKNVSKDEIDYIRGVNSNFILKNLILRGFIEKKPYKGDRRKYIYIPSMDLLSYLGVSRVEDLPEFIKVSSDLKKGLSRADENNDE